MTWLLDSPDVSGLFNVGTGTGRRIADIVAAMGAVADRTVETPRGGVPSAGRFRHSTEARIDRLRAAGFDSPFLPVEDGVERYVRDFLSRDDPYL